MARFILRDSIIACSAMLLAAGAAVSCILPEKCIFIYKTGHRWTGNVAGTAVKIKSQEPSLITGKFTDCKTDAEHAILAAGDLKDPQYIALRSELLADAAVDCAQQASPQEYKQDTVKCDPFSQQYTLTVTVEPNGACTLYSETVLVKGSKDECIGPEESIETSSTSGGADVDNATAPTTTAPTTTESDAPTGGGGTAGTEEGVERAPPEPSVELDTATIHTHEFLRRHRRSGSAAAPSLPHGFSSMTARPLPGPLGFMYGGVAAVDGSAYTHAARFLARVLDALDADTVTVTIEQAGQVQHHIFSPRGRQPHGQTTTVAPAQ